MAKNKVTTSFVEVFKVKGESMNIAFHNLKIEESLDNYNLESVNSSFNDEAINNGKILKHSKFLYRRYINNKISEFTVFGALYNKTPIIRDESRVLLHNIVSKGAKKWETINTYRFDSGGIIHEDTETKSNALAKAKELALEYNKTVNIVVSKRLVGMDGILGIAEFVPFDNVDDTNVYIFWKFGTTVEEKTDGELFDDNVEEVNGQLTIKEDLLSYYGRQIITNNE